MNYVKISNCCNVEMNGDFCPKCEEQTTVIYAGIECKECGGPIKANNDKCMDCNAKFIEDIKNFDLIERG